MEKSNKSINVEGGFLFCGGWNFSKSVSVGSTFIREMRVWRYGITFDGNIDVKYKTPPVTYMFFIENFW